MPRRSYFAFTERKVTLNYTDCKKRILKNNKKRVGWRTKKGLAPTGKSFLHDGWTTRIRTGNDRTKTCSVTITPSSNRSFVAAKVGNIWQSAKFFLPFLILP